MRQRLAAIGALKDYHSFNGGLLYSLDGTQYFSSPQVRCAQCTVIEKETGTRHAHTVLIPALVRPGKAEVLGMEPEFIMPQDGAEKQDCERNAARRWIARIALRLAAQRVTILADDLHCHQPFCELLQAQHLSFILTGKPDSQPTLYEEVALLAQIGAVTQVSDRRWTGQGYAVWTYRYVNQVPLRAGPKALAVNWCALTIVGETTGEVLYHNAWASDYQLTADTIRPWSPLGAAAGGSNPKTTTCSRIRVTTSNTITAIVSNTWRRSSCGSSCWRSCCTPCSSSAMRSIAAYAPPWVPAGPFLTISGP